MAFAGARMVFLKRIRERYTSPCGYREVLNLSIPLILSTGSWSIQQFIDRIFLSWYAADALAAAFPANMLNWTILSLFIGTAGYVNTFVAQYYGSRQFEQIGSAVWQGIYLSAFGVLLILIFYPLSGAIFEFFGHSPNVQRLESEYFQILLLGSPFVILSSAISGFFSGRGDTLTVMWVNLAGTIVNVLFDYLLIFGKLFFPEWGIRGAGWASVMAMVTNALLFFFLMVRPTFQEQFRTLKGWRLRKKLLRRLMRYGFPSGLQFMLEILAFTLFIVLVGRLGMVELAASNVAFNINSLSFLPMYGMTIAVSTMVGQKLGENRPALAEKSTWSAFHLAFTYFFVLALGYFFLPQVFLFPFRIQADPHQFEPVARLSVSLLRFVAIYSLFDAANMIFSGALKGAGDTRFTAIVTIGLSWIAMLVPSGVALYLFQGGLYWLWFFVTLYIAVLGVVFFWRFRNGPWKSMRVIETGGPDE